MSSELIFVDTSAFYALIDRSDRCHASAKTIWPSLLEGQIHLMTSNYIVAETLTLIQYRLGFEAAVIWYKDILGVSEVCFLDESAHRHAYELWVSLGRQNSSFVDCASFTTMNQHGIEKAFCYKSCYPVHGYKLLTGEADQDLASLQPWGVPGSAGQGPAHPALQNSGWRGWHLQPVKKKTGKP